MRKCRKCGFAKPLRMFECTNVERDWYRRECKACTLKRNRELAAQSRKAISDHYLRYRDRIIERVNIWVRENPDKRRKNALNYYYRLQDAALLAYGGYRCSWCGIDDPIVLTIDHVDNDGAEHRKTVRSGAPFYKWLRDQGYPVGYVVLCMNCNHGKMRNGGVLPESLKGRCNDHPRQGSRAKRLEAPGVPLGR